jgi:nicotinate-nucleotide pyrophosphorylase (carboxylating)
VAEKWAVNWWRRESPVCLVRHDLKDNHIDFAGGIALAVAKTKNYLKVD